jgi:ubiquinone/menaquinone biosynthesis C-methylase UbiE
MRPETLEHDWNRLYAEFPEAYDDFTSFEHNPRHIDVLRTRFDFEGKIVVDVGSGTGRSTSELASVAREVIGVEPGEAMRVRAAAAAKQARVGHVEFLDGRAEALPLPDAAADIVAAFWTLFWPPEQTLPAFVAEALRVLRPGGLIVVVDSPPGWYGGELNPILGIGEVPYVSTLDRVLAEQRFDRFDFDTVQEYGTTEIAVRAYGFIFGRRAIEHLRRTGQHAIRWRCRIHHRRREL